MNDLIDTFDKTAAYYDKAAAIPQLVGSQLISRLDLFHHFYPQRVLDLGCGTGYCLKLLQKRYPKAQFIGIDLSRQLLLKAKHYTKKWWGHSPYFIIADIEQLALSTQQFDIVCVNLSLLWVQDLTRCLISLYSLLKPNGLLLLTILGPHSFRELYEPIKNHSFLLPYPWAFCDMHTVGNALVKAQFSDTVMDVDCFSAEYKSIEQGYQELCYLGFHNLLPLSSDISKANFHSNQSFNLTWEIIYGQAWKIDQQNDHFSNEISIPLNQIGSKISKF